MEQFSTICVVGLGLIGGAMVKTIKNKTDLRVYGHNRTKAVSEKAKAEGNIDGIFPDDISANEIDLWILSLYPDACISFVKEHLSEMKPGAVIVDCCGTKTKICNALTDVCETAGVHFIGGHPMAGIEKSGYDASFAGLFDNASMILCKLDSSDEASFERLREFFPKLGFGYVKESNPTEHDRVIAYTSQMAHVVSSAYIKSDACKIRYGISAGSFKDMTRVAYLNETMWTELFLENREFLLAEMEEYISHMREYRDALKASDEEKLCKLLKEGRLCKEADIAGEEKLKKERNNE